MAFEGRRSGAVTFLLAAGLATGACEPAPREPASPEASAQEPDREGLAGVNGTELYYKGMGAGKPLMVVHGGPVLDHGYLVPHLAPLADSYELIFADQRLSGRSAGVVDAASVRLATFVDDIEGLRRELGLGRIHLLAHSWGGLLALHYAILHPENLRSLTLVSPMSPSSELWQQEQEAVAGRLDPADAEAMRQIRESEAFAAREPEAIERMLLLSFKAQLHAPERIADLELYVPDDYMERSRQFGNLAVDLAGYDLQDRLAEVTAPTLVLYGADEPGVALGGAALERSIPDARLLVIERAGHFAFMERPEEFLLAVRDFLGSVDGSR